MRPDEPRQAAPASPLAATTPSSKRLIAAIISVSVVIVGLIAALSYGLLTRGSDSEAPVPSASSSAADAPAPSAAPPAPSTSAPPAPTLDALANATITLPAGCFSSERETATFVDGEAHDAPENWVISAHLEELASTSFEGIPVSIVHVLCIDVDTYNSKFAVYDGSLELLGDFDPTEGGMSILAGVTNSGVSATSMKVDGERMTVNVPGINVADDEACWECTGRATAHVALTWTGTDLDLESITYDIGGAPIAIPDPEEVQAFYDAASRGDDATAAQRIDSRLLDQLRTGCISACIEGDSMETSSVRHIHFPEGGTVGACQFIWTHLIADDGTGRHYPYVNELTFADNRPGDLICGVDVTTSPVTVLEVPSDEYWVWLTIRPTSNPHDFQVIGFGRNFS